MPPDPPKRPGTMGDAARAAIGAPHRRTPRPGYPVEIDPEVTPPPQRVPATLADLSVAVDQLAMDAYRSRHDHERLDAVEIRMGDLNRDSVETGALLREFVVPGLKDTLGRVDGILERLADLFAQQKQFFEREWPEVLRTVAELGRDLSRTERALAKLTDAHDQLEGRVEYMAADARKANDRISALETRQAVATGVQQALTTKQKVGGGIAVAIGGFVSGLLSKYLT